ncbi:MAG TPA: hypothetical protein VFS21_13195 [Roseiflexaceae bacterium]|nr:hypothetical protein [Roseiflexaceae bacterium]
MADSDASGSGSAGERPKAALWRVKRVAEQTPSPVAPSAANEAAQPASTPALPNPPVIQTPSATPIIQSNTVTYEEAMASVPWGPQLIRGQTRSGDGVIPAQPLGPVPLDVMKKIVSPSSSIAALPEPLSGVPRSADGYAIKIKQQGYVTGCMPIIVVFVAVMIFMISVLLFALPPLSRFFNFPVIDLYHPAVYFVLIVISFPLALYLSRFAENVVGRRFRCFRDEPVLFVKEKDFYAGCRNDLHLQVFFKDGMRASREFEVEFYLVCGEVAKSGSGTSMDYFQAYVFASKFASANVHAGADGIDVRVPIQIDKDAMCSFESKHNHIRWMIVARVHFPDLVRPNGRAQPRSPDWISVLLFPISIYPEV